MIDFVWREEEGEILTSRAHHYPIVSSLISHSHWGVEFMALEMGKSSYKM
jgi:hypothetical protein